MDDAQIVKYGAELTEYERRFNLFYSRMTKATKLWRAEKPEERKAILPDLGDLIDWLIERADSRLMKVVDDVLDSDELYDILPGDGQDDYIIGELRKMFKRRIK